MKLYSGMTTILSCIFLLTCMLLNFSYPVFWPNFSCRNFGMTHFSTVELHVWKHFTSLGEITRYTSTRETGIRCKRYDFRSVAGDY